MASLEMAAFKFFNIGKANEEITRLETELAQAKTAQKAAEDNLAEVSTAAEANAASLTQCRADLATAQTSIASLTARAEKAEKELAEAKAKLENPAEQVKVLAAKEAQKITAAQGQPPIDSKPETTAGNVVQQYQSLEGAAKAEFYKAHRHELFNAAKAERAEAKR